MSNVYDDVAQLAQSTSEATLTSIDTAVRSMVQKRDIAKANGDDAPLALSERAQAAIKAVARILAPFKDEITDADLDALQAAIGMSEGIDEQQEHEGEPVEQAAALSSGGDDEDEDKPELEEKLGHDLYPEEGKPSEDRNQHAPIVAKAADAMSMECPPGVDPEHHAKAMDAAKEAYTKNIADKGYVQKTNEDAPMTDANEVLKRLDAFPQAQRDQVQALFRSTMDEHKKLIRKSKALEAELQHERDIRLDQEYLTKANILAPDLGDEDRRDMAKILKSLASTDKPAADKLEAILKSAHAQHEEVSKMGGLFGEYGSRLSGGGAGSAESKLDALVDSIVMKTSGEKTREQIYKQVVMSPEGKKLWREIEGHKNGI